MLVVTVGLALLVLLLSILLICKHGHAKLLQNKLNLIGEDNRFLAAKYEDSYFRPVSKKK